MKRKSLLSLFVLSLLLFVNSAFAVNYLQGSDSVDDWEIRWGGSTKYTTEWNNAISVWNNHGSINIAPDTAYTYEDLTVDDVYAVNSGWSWRMWTSAGSDDLELNTYYLDMSVYTSVNDQHTIAHELWHSLGLAHHSLSWNMLQSGRQSNITVWSQDEKDYDYLWE